MWLCLNQACGKANPPEQRFCRHCGKPLKLKDRYYALAVIGQGGFGKTFKAKDDDKPSKPYCVIKQYYPTGRGNLKKALELFDQEATRLDELGHHSQIPSLLSHCEYEGHRYIVQEFVDGENLEKVLETTGAWNEAQIRELLLDLLPVLEFIHQHQVIHRDIKPENIIRRNSDRKLVVVDFGAAKYATATALQRTGTRIGSAEYAAPEQARGHAVFASDLYGLGVTCLHLLTQVDPYDLYSPSEGEFVWEHFLQNNPVSSSLSAILNKMTQDRVPDRYKTAAEVLQALGSPVQASTPDQQVLNSPSQFSAPQPPNPHTQTGYIEFLGQGATLKMGAIPTGTFWMGAPEGELGAASTERPQHQVTIPEFYMGKYAVTQAQWQAVAALPQVKRSLDPNPSCGKGTRRPVECVSWDDAMEFCDRLSWHTGKIYRLPTEAEWEYACRAGTTTPFSFGETITIDQVNYNGKYPYGSSPYGIHRRQTTEVDSFPSNRFGLYEMHGNVYEWCADDWHETYGQKTEHLKQNGSVIWSSSYEGVKVLRGGSWNNDAIGCRSASRFRLMRSIRNNGTGFRLVHSSQNS